MVPFEKLHHTKFWPPFLLVSITIGLSLTYQETFLQKVKYLNDIILNHFGGLFAWSALIFLLLLGIIYFSPLSQKKIGGKSAKPLLTKWRWFSITLCTTIATGILFWGTAEPLFHLNQPPTSLGFSTGSIEARNFSMSTMFMHWTLSPYSMYTLAGLVFAISYYNDQQPFQIGSLLYPIFGQKAHGNIGTITDIVCLYSLIAGMSASLGAGILTISGGLTHVFHLESSDWILAGIGLFIIISFITSAASGLMHGIRLLSDFNVKMFIFIAAIFIIFGPLKSMLETGYLGLIQYFTHLIPRSVNWNQQLDPSWFQSWTLFNWANWLAWTPITALFLGRLSFGYTVREYIQTNLLLPALFSGLWMIIFSGSALEADIRSQGGLFHLLQTIGPESVIYQLIDQMPWSTLIIMMFLFATFLSYVTAADSNTSAMSNICTKGISPESPESPLYIKIVWGVVIGLLSWIMITFAGMDGIKMISVLGGFPALLLIIIVAIGAIKILILSFKSNRTP